MGYRIWGVRGLSFEAFLLHPVSGLRFALDLRCFRLRVSRIWGPNAQDPCRKPDHYWQTSSQIIFRFLVSDL